MKTEEPTPPSRDSSIKHTGKQIFEFQVDNLASVFIISFSMRNTPTRLVSAIGGVNSKTITSHCPHARLNDDRFENPLADGRPAVSWRRIETFGIIRDRRYNGRIERNLRDDRHVVREVHQHVLDPNSSLNVAPLKLFHFSEMAGKSRADGAEQKIKTTQNT
jgi:hypothetical protein